VRGAKGDCLTHVGDWLKREQVKPQGARTGGKTEKPLYPKHKESGGVLNREGGSAAMPRYLIRERTGADQERQNHTQNPGSGGIDAVGLPTFLGPFLKGGHNIS